MSLSLLLLSLLRHFCSSSLGSRVWDFFDFHLGRHDSYNYIRPPTHIHEEWEWKNIYMYAPDNHGYVQRKMQKWGWMQFHLDSSHFFLGLHCFSAVKLKTDENFSSFLSASLFRLRNNAWGSFTLCFTHSLYFTPYLLLLAQFPLPTSAIHHWETETKKKRNINLERGKLGWISIHLDFFVMSDCLQERIFGIGGGKKTRQTHTQCIHWMTNFILEKKRVKIEALPFLQQPDEGRKNVLKM